MQVPDLFDILIEGRMISFEEGCFSLNDAVDGPRLQARPILEAAGIGGIMRDSNGTVLGIFSKSVGVEESNVAEFLAIREAVTLFLTSRWSEYSLTVESDSINAVTWVNNPDSTPWKLRNLSNHLRNLLQGIVSWKCVHIYREANSEADTLARQGVERVNDLISFFT